MNIAESFKISLLNLKSNKVRSLLSMLGVIIGVAAVIIVVSITNGMKEYALKSIGPADYFIYTIYPKFNEKTNALTEFKSQDLEIFKSIPCAQTVLPVFDTFFDFRTAKKNMRGFLTAADAGYLNTHRLKLQQGRNINALDLQQRSGVCLISASLAKQFFYNPVPIGEKIFCGAALFTVIGIIEISESAEFVNSSYQEMVQTNDFLIPFSTALRLNPNQKINQLRIYVDKNYHGSVLQEIQKALDENNKKHDDYSIQDPKDVLAQIEKQSKEYTLFLSGIAAISLLVGGIGIMNVMLTSVAERTREIGIRKAVGANQKDILLQFMIESCVICMMGGVLGIGLGVCGAALVPWISSQKTEAAILPSSLAISFLFSLIVGLIFGIFPAIRASRLSPAQALRSE